jgi:hypothetical protein
MRARCAVGASGGGSAPADFDASPDMAERDGDDLGDRGQAGPAVFAVHGRRSGPDAHRGRNGFDSLERPLPRPPVCDAASSPERGGEALGARPEVEAPRTPSTRPRVAGEPSAIAARCDTKAARRGSGEEMDLDQKLKELIGVDGAIIITLVVLSLLGVGLTNAAAGGSRWMWVALVPTFGLGLGYIEWRHSESGGAKKRVIARHVLRHVLHWGSLLVALQLLYLFNEKGLLEREGEGLTALLLFTLSAFLAAVHLDGRFVILALALVAEAYVVTFWEEYDAVLTISAVVVAALFGGAVFLTRRREKAAQSAS